MRLFQNSNCAMADIGRYKVPTGLRPLLEALAREVLRAQPDDLVAFSQLFFAELQHQRKCEKKKRI